MNFAWGVLWDKSRKPLKVGWLIVAGLLALCVGFLQPHERERGVDSERGTGLAAVAGGSWRPMSMFTSAKKVSYESRVPAQMAMLVSGGGGEDEAAANRKLVTTTSISIVVKAPSESAEQIIKIAERAGGFLVSSQVNSTDVPSASLSIRVPTAKFENVRTEMRKLALRVESESTQAQDVTKQYVDDEARLRNLRAEEEQYLGLLRKATNVKDTLEVTDKLNETRGAIEEKQAEFAALSKQVEMVAIDINLRAEADAQIFGLHWRPLYQLKIAAREGLDGLGDYAASMAAFVFYLPTILLWLFTILALAAIGWRILRWVAKTLFRSRKLIGEAVRS